MRYKSMQPMVLLAAVLVLALYGACVALKPCTVSPVEIEELKSDVRDLDAKLVERKALLAKLEAEIVELQARIEARRLEYSAVDGELSKLKKASGVTERPAQEKTPSVPALDMGS